METSQDPSKKTDTFLQRNLSDGLKICISDVKFSFVIVTSWFNIVAKLVT